MAITLVVVYYVSRDLVYPCMATLNYDFFIDHGWMNMRPGLDIQGPETFAAHLGIWAPTITLWITALLLIASCVFLLVNRYWWTGWITLLLASLTIVVATADRIQDSLFNNSMGLLIQNDDATMTVASGIAITCAVILLLKILHWDKPLMRITTKD